MSAIDTSYNDTIKIPFRDPDDRIAYAKIDIINGESYKDFKTTKYGEWVILSKYNFEGKNAKIYPASYNICVLMDL